jgi:hypothetical protein
MMERNGLRNKSNPVSLLAKLLKQIQNLPSGHVLAAKLFHTKESAPRLPRPSLQAHVAFDDMFKRSQQLRLCTKVTVHCEPAF